MPRLVRLTLPLDRGGSVWSMIIGELSEHVHGPTFVEAKGADGAPLCVIEFKSVEKHLTRTLECLAEVHGLSRGAKGSLDIMALQTTYPSLKKTVPGARQKRKSDISNRQTIQEIEEAIDSGAHLTFDYVAMTAVAAMISAVGLCTDSAVSVVASMLVSPLMGPILAFSYGFSVRKQHMVALGIRNELYGVAICLGVGAMIGLLGALIFYSPMGIEKAWVIAEKLTGRTDLESFEVNSRGEPWALFVGFWVAAPSGVGVALAITNTSINALVGVAISAALLPPVVNAGLCFTMGLVYVMSSDETTQAEGRRFLGMGGISFALFLLNILVIFVFSLITFRAKNVVWNRLEFGRQKEESELVGVSSSASAGTNRESSKRRLIPRAGAPEGALLASPGMEFSLPKITLADKEEAPQAVL